MELHKLNCLGVSCPIPIVKLFKQVRSIAVGDMVEVTCDDIAFPHDVRAWCDKTGHQLINLTSVGKISTATIKKN